MMKNERRTAGRWLGGARQLARRAAGLLRCLSAGERAGFDRAVADVIDRVLAERMHDLPDDPVKDEVHRRLGNLRRDGRLLEGIDEVLRDVADAAAGKANRRRDRKPGNTARDEAIVRVVDDEGVPYKRVGRRLIEINPEWTDDGGDPLSADAVRKAYRRAKQRGRPAAAGQNRTD